MTAHALRDWCRFAATVTSDIEPGSPWQNPVLDSFNGRVRHELLGGEQFPCPAEARVLIADGRKDHDHSRPHRALGMEAPAVFAREWAAGSQT